MDNITALENRIKELEYRLSVVEKLLDASAILFHKNDESFMNAIKLETMKQQGMDATKYATRLGTKLFT